MRVRMRELRNCWSKGEVIREESRLAYAQWKINCSGYFIPSHNSPRSVNAGLRSPSSLSNLSYCFRWLGVGSLLIARVTLSRESGFISVGMICSCSWAFVSMSGILMLVQCCCFLVTSSFYFVSIVVTSMKALVKHGWLSELFCRANLNPYWHSCKA